MNSFQFSLARQSASVIQNSDNSICASTDTSCQHSVFRGEPHLLENPLSYTFQYDCSQLDSQCQFVKIQYHPPRFLLDNSNRYMYLQPGLLR